MLCLTPLRCNINPRLFDHFLGSIDPYSMLRLCIFHSTYHFCILNVKHIRRTNQLRPINAVDLCINFEYFFTHKSPCRIIALVIFSISYPRLLINRLLCVRFRCEYSSTLTQFPSEKLDCDHARAYGSFLSSTFYCYASRR